MLPPAKERKRKIALRYTQLKKLSSFFINLNSQCFSFFYLLFSVLEETMKIHVTGTRVNPLREQHRKKKKKKMTKRILT